jgi:hypothetical protein
MFGLFVASEVVRVLLGGFGAAKPEGSEGEEE